MEGLSKSDANLIVYVHPSQSKNVDKAILRELSSLLFKYSQAFDGVVLAYSVDPQDKCARILSGVHPYFGVRLRANLLIFSPKPKMLLEGKVVKITRESIHCIVLGFSSAIITDENIRNELKYKAKHGEGAYVSRYHKRHVIKVGAVIRFEVKSLDEEILHISGSLIPANTGSVHWLDKYFVDAATDSNKETKTEEEMEMQEQITVGGETLSFVNDHEIKKSKKRRRAADQ
ncbi:DNA-directed RNA polymerase I subunit RPA43 isoform X1 [Populus alba x Populus x berolinensis]|nr:DNA-directed RNA polymerase I subunit RPA43 isoform X1 [Populus alba x Populus x berolinensis]